MSAELVIGNGLKTDDGVALGHRPSRSGGSGIGDAVSVWSTTVVDYGCVIGNRTGATSLARVRWSPETSPRTWWPTATRRSRAATSRSSRASRPACAGPTRPVWRRRHNRQPPRTTSDNR
jgi:hypothetical protein